MQPARMTQPLCPVGGATAAPVRSCVNDAQEAAMAEAANVPTLFEWAGGLPAFEKLTAIFYAKVPQDPLLASLFVDISPEHANRVAHFIAEVFGGPPLYTRERGGHPTMIHEHLGRHLSEPQRHRFFDLLCQS